MRLSGLERTDNNLDLTTWPQVSMINQKNYYTSVFPVSFPFQQLPTLLHHGTFSRTTLRQYLDPACNLEWKESANLQSRRARRDRRARSLQSLGKSVQVSASASSNIRLSRIVP